MSMPVPLQVQQAYDLSGTMRLFLAIVVHLLLDDRFSMSRPPPMVGGRMQNQLPGGENPESIAGCARASFVNVALADLPDAVFAPADASALGADQRLGDALIKSSHGFHLSFVSWCRLLVIFIGCRCRGSGHSARRFRLRENRLSPCTIYTASHRRTIRTADACRPCSPPPVALMLDFLLCRFRCRSGTARTAVPSTKETSAF